MSGSLPEPEVPDEVGAAEGGGALEGGCMCGAVRFRISEPLLGAVACYCTRCQRRTGTAFSATALTTPGSFAIVAGDDHVGSWDPGDGWIKFHCVTCGGALYTRHPDNPELISVRMGAVDGDPGVRISTHQFVTYKADWYEIPDDGCPRFPERLGVGDPLSD
jgi:hypothetical protein